MSDSTPTVFYDVDAAKALLDKGLLFEVNRRVLHPFGYALGARFNDDDAKLEPGKFLGFFLTKSKDPAGMLFEEETFKEAYKKFLAFLDEEGLKTLDARSKELGFRVQEQVRQRDTKE